MEVVDLYLIGPFYREYFRERGWDRPEAITYKFNSEGFRCEEFDDSPCLVALGCSFTFGNALPVDAVEGSTGFGLEILPGETSG